LDLIAEARQLLPDACTPEARIHHTRLGFYEGRAFVAKGELIAPDRALRRIWPRWTELATTLLSPGGAEAAADVRFSEACLGCTGTALPRAADGHGFSKPRRNDVDDAAQLISQSLRMWFGLGVRAGIGLARLARGAWCDGSGRAVSG
jgi:hypothetical protein